MEGTITKAALSELTHEIIGAAICIHRHVGPGMIESVYEALLCEELSYRNIRYSRQQYVPIYYRGKTLDAKLRYDILVDDVILLELKAVVTMHPIYDAIIISYMKLLEIPKGLLINFCTPTISQGVKSFVNNQYRSLPED